MVLHPQIMFLLLGFTSLMVPPCASFYPNRESLGGIKAQFTDDEITEQGVLRAVALFMERHPLPNYRPFTPGQLENLSPLTPASLFQTYYGGPVSAERFSQAIQEIVIGNNFIEQQYENSEEYFFYCDSFQKANQVIITKRASIIHDLKEKAHDSEAMNNARMKIGEVLHTIQKFYSNSNWLEMGKTEPYAGLGRDDVAFFPIVSRAKTTCAPCPKKNGMYTCQDNLIEKRLLTSGYRKVGLCINKPQGKCNHGGINDKWQDQAPAGGINKETNDALVSPHYMWHEAAGQQAVLATRDFFISNNGGLLESVGEFMFRTLFSMNGFSITFVIDVSASMEDDISAIKTTCYDILERHKNSLDAPFNYILVPFNDPDVGPVLETRNVSVLKAAINDLNPDGGGDCPEMALTGLELALKNSLPQSKIFFFSDASAKDKEEKQDSVMTLTEQTKSMIKFYITGTCEEEQLKGDNNEFAQNVTNGRKARVRRSTGRNIFHELSELSGGSYMMTSKKELRELLNDMELTMNSAPVTVLQKRVANGQLFVPIDHSLLDFAISVTSENSFTLSLLRPDGSPVKDGKNLVDTPTYKVLLIHNPSPQGSWSLAMEGTAPCDVIITGKSIQDFSYQIMHNKNGFILPIQGRPVADKEYTLQVKPSVVNRNFSIDEVLILNVHGNIVQRFSAQPLPGSLSGMTSVRARFTSLEPMMVGVCGTTAGTKYCRLQRQLVFIEKIRLNRVRGETTMIKPGESINVSIVLSNDGAYDDFIIDVKDQLNLLTTYSPQTISLNQGHNITIVSTFSAPAEFNDHTSSLVRVVVKTPRRGTSETYNYLTFAVTTIPQNALIVDTEPPIVNFTGSPANCTKEYQHGENCSTYSWELQFKAQDEQSKANLSVTVTHGNQVDVDTWQEGDVMVGKYSSSCCFPYVEIKIYDMYGNTQDISLDNSKERTPTLHPNEISGPMIIAIGGSVGVAFALLACITGFVMSCRKRKSSPRVTSPHINAHDTLL